jgi:hypothetical protein
MLASRCLGNFIGRFNRCLLVAVLCKGCCDTHKTFRTVSISRFLTCKAKLLRFAQKPLLLLHGHHIQKPILLHFPGRTPGLGNRPNLFLPSQLQFEQVVLRDGLPRAIDELSRSAGKYPHFEGSSSCTMRDFPPTPISPHLSLRPRHLTEDPTASNRLLRTPMGDSIQFPAAVARLSRAARNSLLEYS